MATTEDVLFELLKMTNRFVQCLDELAALKESVGTLRREIMGVREQIIELQARDTDTAVALTGIETALAAEKLEVDAIVARLTELETAGTAGLAELIASAQERASKLAAITAGINGLVTVTQAPLDTEIPFAPGGVTVGNVTESSAEVSWQPATDNIGVVGYRLFQDGVEIARPVGTTTSHSVTGLTAATPYSFAVAAYDAAGNVSPQSEVLTITTR